MIIDRLIIFETQRVPIYQRFYCILIRWSRQFVLDLALKQLLSKVNRQLYFISSSFHVISYQQANFTINSERSPKLCKLIKKYNVIFLINPILLYSVNRKNNNIIQDSKRTMKNLQKKQNKTIKMKQHASLNSPPLQFTNNYPTRINEDQVLKTILSGTSNKLMQGFSSTQKKIISQQFSKLMKSLKKKLASPQKIADTQRSRMQTRTQRFQVMADPYNSSKETIRKNICTERKPVQVKSPKNKTKTINKELKHLSPQKSKRHNQNGSQLADEYRNSDITSPKKAKKSIKTQKIQKLNSPSKKQGKLKRRKITTANDSADNYVLLGQNFIQVDGNQMKQMQSQIMFQQSGYEKDSELQYIWKDFMDEKQKLSKIRVLSYGESKNTKMIDTHPLTTSPQQKQQSQQPQNDINLTQQKQRQKQQMLEYQFYNSSDIEQQKNDKIQLKFPQINKSIPIPILQSASLQNSQVNTYERSPMKMSRSNQQQDSIQMRTDAINLQIKTNTQILNKLLQSGKIDKLQYQIHMDLAIQIYDKQMTQIQQIKQIIQKNQQKVDNLLKKAKNALQLTQKLESIDANEVLQTVFGPHKKQIQQNNKIKATKGQPHIFDQIQKYTLASNKSDLQQSPTKTQKSHSQHSSNQQKVQSPSKKVQQIKNYDTFRQEIQQQSKNLKQLIQNRTAFQLGIVPQICNQGIRTSVASVFQFIKNFYSFIKAYHVQQLINYANMPYGYSVQQRLRYMQGYDDDDELEQNPINGIVYGLEEVLRPNLLDIFHEEFYYKHHVNVNRNDKNYQKAHHKAIFDAINQAINKFRPYFIINGPPYPWTSSQKSLTYYFIRQDCYQQLLQRVQLQVLKWSSSLCGLLIPQACQIVPEMNKQKLSIQQIFQKYTVETDCQLLQQRQAKIMKQQKIQINQTHYQWVFHDQFKTALLYQISSAVLEELANQVGQQLHTKMMRREIAQLYRDCGLSQSQIQ